MGINQGINVTDKGGTGGGGGGITPTLTRNEKIFIATAGQTAFSGIMFELGADNYIVFIGGNLYTGNIIKTGNVITGYTLTIAAQDENTEIVVVNYTLANSVMTLSLLTDILTATAGQTVFNTVNVDLSTGNFDVFIGGNLVTAPAVYSVTGANELTFVGQQPENTEIVVLGYVLI